MNYRTKIQEIFQVVDQSRVCDTELQKKKTSFAIKLNVHFSKHKTYILSAIIIDLLTLPILDKPFHVTEDNVINYHQTNKLSFLN